MTCQEKWSSISPGSVVRLQDGTQLLRLSPSDRRDQFDGSTVELSTGRMGHLAEFVILHEEFTNQFEIV